MPHTSLAARKRSKNPRVRNALLDASPYARKTQKRQTSSPFRGIFQTAATAGEQKPPTTAAPKQDFAAGANIFLQQAAGLIPTDPSAAPPAIMAALQLQRGAGLISDEQLQKAMQNQQLLATAGGPAPTGAVPTTVAPGATSAFGIGGPFLMSTDNPFTAERFFGQRGDGDIPTVNLPFIAGAGAGAGKTGVPENIMRVGSMLGATPGARADFARFLGMGQPTAEDSPETIAADEAAAARLMATNVQNNPFISPEGLSMLQRGLVPNPNMIQAAFWRHSDPVTKQTLLGLFQRRGLLPEQLGAAAEAARPS